nr:prohibitin family protein [uncultured Rhodopila sp.]
MLSVLQGVLQVLRMLRMLIVRHVLPVLRMLGALIVQHVPPVLRGLRDRSVRLWRDKMPETLVAFLILMLALMYLWPFMIYSVGPGFYGVLWKRFGNGTVLTHTYGEGVHIIFPWDRLYMYDGRLQLIEQNFDVLSSDGLKMIIRVAIRFQLNPPEIPALHKYVGPDYQQVLVQPQIGALARYEFSANSPEEIFSQRREEIDRRITADMTRRLDEATIPLWHSGRTQSLIRVEDVLMQDVTLPPSVAAAIDAKNVAKQETAAYNYRLQSAVKEAERKQIEARGIKAFQDTVAPGLTDNYLRWTGIQSTLALANSPNAKVVIIGSGNGGLPLILGNLEDGKARESTAPAQSRTAVTGMSDAAGPAPPASGAQPVFPNPNPH